MGGGVGVGHSNRVRWQLRPSVQLMANPQRPGFSGSNPLRDSRNSTARLLRDLLRDQCCIIGAKTRAPGVRHQLNQMLNTSTSPYEPGGRRFAHLGPPEPTKPVISRRRINPSEGKTRQISRKYYPRFWSRSLTGAAFRAMTGRTVNPQVPGSSPGRRANSTLNYSDSAR